MNKRTNKQTVIGDSEWWNEMLAHSILEHLLLNSLRQIFSIVSMLVGINRYRIKIVKVDMLFTLVLGAVVVCRRHGVQRSQTALSC
jgi:hypothetical protein